MKSALQDTVKSWSLKRQRQFRILRSSKKVYTVVCETKGCNFKVHAHVPKYESYWVVSTLEEHNYMVQNMRSSHHNLSAAYVANKYYKEIIEGDDLPVRHIVKLVENGKYRGQILTIVGADANNQIIPVAFAFVKSENYDSWLWFLQHLK
ncbi:hypothetical protein E2562_018264 [Oryza meyeriana var. granulata]|uniref:Transposase MuDR plant domain-containing protein n=1 Tax=Oryza meyeriana var. granulata TaxID=110450 RepID=A0A6G1CSR6_9ORYZ|nr:hypothetical protein E2562_018264 [Oryza meyeriana var. granulata]